MASYAPISLTDFGLINDTPSPSVRAVSNDPVTDSEAAVREPVESDTTPQGEPFFVGFNSEITLSSADIDDFDQASTWQENHTPVKAVALAESFFIQVYEPTRIRAMQQADVTATELMKGDHMIRREGGDQTSHGVYITRNGLSHLQPVDSNGDTTGGWADTDSDGVPEGYSAADLKSTAFSSNVFEAYVDTSSNSDGNLGVIIPFPVPNVTVTLSVEITQVLNSGNDGNHNLRIEALKGDQAVLTSSSKTFTTTGRKFVDLTTPANTHFLAVYPFRGTSVSNENAKAKVKNPCLRVDGETTYVPR